MLDITLESSINGQIEILTGRPLLAVGAHVKEDKMNQRSIGICVVGNYDLLPPSSEYLETLAPVLFHLCKIFQLTPDKIVRHQDFAPYKSCPGNAFNLAGLRMLVRSMGAI